MERTVQYEIGIGLWGQVRDWIGVWSIQCPSIRWHEGRGWLTRKFTITGPAEKIMQIDRSMRQVSAQLNQAASQESK